MQKNATIEIPKMYRTLLNHLYEIERKVGGLEDFKKIDRNIERMKDAFRTELNADIELFYEDPMGQSYDETRNDLDANIAGESTENLFVVDVIKPIIRYRDSRIGLSKIVQKGVVIVNSNTNQEEVDK
jgi:hypothetical protein